MSFILNASTYEIDLNAWAPSNGTTDALSGITSAIAYGISLISAQPNLRSIVFKGNGVFRTSGEIDLTSWPTGNCGYRFKGDAPGAFIFKPDAFGRNKAVFNCAHGNVTNKVAYAPEFQGLRIQGNSSANDPVGIYAPYIESAAKWYDVDFVTLGNSAIVNIEADNFKWEVGDFQKCGGQYIEKTLGTCYWSGTAGSGATISFHTTTGGTAYVGAVTGMAGKTIYLNGGYSGGGIFKATIDTVPGDGSSCTIVETLPATRAASAGYKASFGYVTGTIGAGDLSSMEVSADVFVADDVGGCRYIYIMGAGDDTATTSLAGHLTRISAVNGTTITLEEPALQAVTDARIIVGPGAIFGLPPSAQAAGALTNDVKLVDIRNEQSQGAGWLLLGVSNFWISGKTHGIPNNTNDFGKWGYLSIVDTCNSGVHFDNALFVPLGNGNLNGTGAIYGCGFNTKLSITGGSVVNTTGPDVSAVHWAVNASSTRAQLHWGAVTDGEGFNKYPIKVDDYATYASVLWAANTESGNSQDFSLGYVPQSGFQRATSFATFGPFDAVANDTKVILDPVMRRGIAKVFGGPPGDQIVGEAYFVTTRDGDTAVWYQIAAGTGINFFVSTASSSTYDASTEGNPGVVNVALTTDAKIVLSNRTGSNKSTLCVVLFGAGN